MRDPSLPVRKGKVYCAPWCGAGCTWEAYEEATKESKALAKKLSRHFGVPFLPVVWENMGWYYKATCGPPEFHLKVYAQRTHTATRYSTLLGVGAGGDPRWSVGSGMTLEDPVEAVTSQLTRAWNVIQLDVSGFSVLTKGMKSWRGK